MPSFGVVPLFQDRIVLIAIYADRAAFGSFGVSRAQRTIQTTSDNGPLLVTRPKLSLVFRKGHCCVKIRPLRVGINGGDTVGNDSLVEFTRLPAREPWLLPWQLSGIRR